jgi:hypothetical protein
LHLDRALERPIQMQKRGGGRWVVGIAAGVLVAVAVGAALLVRSERGERVETATPATTFPVTILEPDAATAAPVLLAWAQGGMTDAAIDAARAVPGVTAVAVVRDGRLDLDAGDGWRIPLDAIAVDPAEYAAVVPPSARGAIAGLGAGEAILGSTSARLRGDPRELPVVGGDALEVAGVLPDSSVGAAEVVVDVATGAALGIDDPRAILVAGDADRGMVEAAVAAALPGEPIRFRSADETAYLRAADAVLPQSIVKATYGEFRYRPTDDGDADAIEIDPAWVEANIVTVDGVSCHRLVVETVVEILDRVGAPNGDDGCFVPRTSRTSEALSRHSWGIAVDIGFGEAQEPALVDAFGKAGFTWGGTWLSPDPAHFEVQGPRPPPG